jgi:hypothetical protein
MKQLCTCCRSKRHFYLLLVFILSSALVTYAQTNQTQPVYIAFSYYKTAPGKFNDYKNLIETYSKKILDHEVQQGNLISWSAYEVLMPSGTAADYNIVSITVSNKLDQLLDPPLTGQQMYAQVFPQMDSQQIQGTMQKFVESRSLIKREIYSPLSTTTEKNGPPVKVPTKYVQVDYMTPVPGKEAQYVKMEEDTFRPIHKQRMNLNALKGWALLGKILPGDSNDPAPYVTINFYDNFDGMIDSKYTEATKKAWPTQDINKLFQTIGTVKKGQRSELWKLMETDSMQGKQ